MVIVITRCEGLFFKEWHRIRKATAYDKIKKINRGLPISRQSVEKQDR